MYVEFANAPTQIGIGIQHKQMMFVQKFEILFSSFSLKIPHFKKIQHLAAISLTEAEKYC